MTTRVAFAILALAATACDKPSTSAEPSPPASASAAPVRSAPFSAVSAIIASASAEPPATATVTPMPGIPPIESACTKDEDCGTTYFDQLCCTDCMPRIGNKTSTKNIDAFCKAHKPDSCPKPAPCGFLFGAPRCNGGRCMAR